MSPRGSRVWRWVGNGVPVLAIVVCALFAPAFARYGIRGGWAASTARVSEFVHTGSWEAASRAEAMAAARVRMPEVAAFLAQDHQLELPAPRADIAHFAWKDNRPQIVRIDGTDYRDPARDVLEIVCTALVDRDAIAAVEAHFGWPARMPARSYFVGDAAESAFERAYRESLASHGCRMALDPRAADGRSMVVSPDYAWLVSVSRPLLAPVASKVVSVFPAYESRHSQRRTVDALTSFVQRAVPYVTIPPASDGKERAGLRTPGTTLLQGGDCDSKCVLLATLIRSIDPALPVAVVNFRRGGPGDQGHSMLFVGMDPAADDVTMDLGGRRMVAVETTDGWDIGRVPNEFDPAEMQAFFMIP